MEELNKGAQRHCIDQGFKYFDPGGDMEQRCPYINESRRIFWRIGWRKAEVAYEREQAYQESREYCPVCGQDLESKLSGKFCSNQTYCGYHTHEE